MARTNGTRARILRLYATFTALDAPLLARALNTNRQGVTANLTHLRREGHITRAERRNARRPYSRVEYREVQP